MGLVDGGGVAGLGYWQIIKPVAGVNLVTNPSFEKDTTSWTPPTGTLVRTAGAGVFGAYGGRFTAAALNDYTGVTVSAVNGTAYVCSVYFRSSSPLVYLRGNNGVTTVDQAHPGDGLCHRLEVTVTAGAGNIMQAIIVDPRSSAWTPVDIDGMQIEVGSVATTYMDGDQDGCIWTGAPHASTATRDGRDGRGGQIVSLDVIGLQVKAPKGIGAPEMEVATQTLALGDGGLYQRSAAKVRTITLESLITFDGQGLASLHAKRRTIIDLFRPDGRTNRGPIVLRYAGPTVPKRIQTYYQSGLEMDTLGGIQEEPPIKLMAPQPDWQSEVEEQAVPASSQNVTGVSRLALLSPSGVWSNMGGGADAASDITAYPFRAVRMPDGKIVVSAPTGSGLVNFGGVSAADYLAQWDGSAWSVVGSAAPASAGVVTDISLGANGNLYAAALGAVGGITAHGVAQYAPGSATWTSLNTTLSGVTPFVNSVVFEPSTGRVYAVGHFSAIDGVSATNCAYYTGSAWVDASSGLTIQPLILLIGPDGRVYTEDGTTIKAWTGSTWTTIAAVAGGSIWCILSAGGRLYVGGDFTSIGGVSISGLAVWNGSSWSALGSGITATRVSSLAADQAGNIYVAGKNFSSVGGLTTTDAIAVWNGSTWLPFAVNPPNTATPANDFYTVFSLSDGSVLLGWGSTTGTFGTTLVSQALTAVTNSGTSNAYPVIEFNGTGAVYQLVNVTTGQSIIFSNCVVSSGEIAKLDLRPCRKTFTSIGRNLLSTILPASDVSAFCLAPGANSIAVYVASGTVSMHWTPRHWSAD